MLEGSWVVRVMASSLLLNNAVPWLELQQNFWLRMLHPSELEKCLKSFFFLIYSEFFIISILDV